MNQRMSVVSKPSKGARAKRLVPGLSAVVPLVLLALTGCGPVEEERSDSGPRTASQSLDYNNVMPGRGYDNLTDTVSDYCVDFDGPSPIAGTDGQRVIFSLDLIDNSKTLALKMDVKASANIKYELYGGDGKAQFIADTNLSETSVFLLATVQVRNPPKVLTNIRLKDSARETLKANPARFRERCGDGYISSIVEGGDFFGLIEIQTSTLTEKYQLISSLNAKQVLGMWSASGAFELAVNSTVQNKRIRIRTLQNGGRGETANGCDTVQCLIDRAKQMPTYVAAHPVLLEAPVLSYRKLELPLDSMPPVDTQNQEAVQRDLVAARLTARDWRGRFQAALDKPEDYEPFDRVQVQDAINTLNENLNTLSLAASECFRDYTACRMPALKSITTPFPRWLGHPGGFNLLVHLENIGDLVYRDGQFAGTRGESRRLEGFQITLDPPVPGLSLEYMAHLQDIGDTAWVSQGQFIGTRGEARRLEGFAIRLTGPNAEHYDVTYMCHIQNVGDSPTYANGAFCGTRGQSLRAEGLSVKITPRKPAGSL